MIKNFNKKRVSEITQECRELDKAARELLNEAIKQRHSLIKMVKQFMASFECSHGPMFSCQDQKEAYFKAQKLLENLKETK